jgi:hypothetical protein
MMQTIIAGRYAAGASSNLESPTPRIGRALPSAPGARRGYTWASLSDRRFAGGDDSHGSIPTCTLRAQPNRVYLQKSIRSSPMLSISREEGGRGKAEGGGAEGGGRKAEGGGADSRNAAEVNSQGRKESRRLEPFKPQRGESS